jgi:phage tail protein X
MTPRPISLALLLSALAFSGCGFVHFGRIPRSDPAIASENADLRLEKKILQQELVLARKEEGALRIALDAKQGGEGEKLLAQKLRDSTKELSELRSEYSRLQASLQSNRGASDTVLVRNRMKETEDQLADRLRELNELRKEADGLRAALSAQRRENGVLEGKVKGLVADSQRTQLALSQLDNELTAQKEARAQADQAVEAMRAQLRAVLAREKSAASATSLSASPGAPGQYAGAPAQNSAGLSVPAAGAEPAKPTALLSISQARMGAQGGSDPRPLSARVASSTSEAATVRRYQVQEGDTLELIARKYYGNPERWRVIYAANNALLRNGKALRPGMEIVIPEEIAPNP